MIIRPTKANAKMAIRRSFARPMAANASAGRTLTHINGAIFNTNTKHDHYSDFGWPESIEFEQLYRMYCRNSLASAVVDKTISKVWQEYPEIWEQENPAMTKSEVDIARRFNDIRVWKALAEADRRAMVGRYSAVILRLGDNQPFDQPVGFVTGGLKGLVGLIPCWQEQLTPTEWDNDPSSSGYGTPKMYQFNESAITDTINNAPRQFAVHPDRVIIWSDDGTIHCRSELESIYNDLIDAEKIKGAGGEGFWKTSRGAPMIEAAEGLSPDALAKAMGTDVAGLREAVNDQIDDFNRGFDKGLILGGMTAKPLQISLPSPEHFFAGLVNSIAAAREMPVRILMGSMSGERASTEDAKAWALTCNSRRVNRCKPLIHELLTRLERFKIILEKDWVIGWADLTESTGEERIERALKMAEINAKTQPGDEAAFLPDEIRETAGWDPLEPSDLDGDDSDSDEERE